MSNSTVELAEARAQMPPEDSSAWARFVEENPPGQEVWPADIQPLETLVAVGALAEVIVSHGK